MLPEDPERPRYAAGSKGLLCPEGRRVLGAAEGSQGYRACVVGKTPKGFLESLGGLVVTLISSPPSVSPTCLCSAWSRAPLVRLPGHPP